MKIHLRTFGCRANHYDTEVVRAAALAAGHEIVEDDRDADLAVFNSCAVTAEAERDLRKAIRGSASRNPTLRSVVMGCAAALEVNSGQLGELPSVRHVVAGADVDAVARILGATSAPSTSRQRSVRAVLRIQDGCDAHCTFCATTLARGANRSRNPESLMDEAQRLADHHPEIVLTGTHIGTYGADIGSSLGALVETLIARVPSVRFRLSSVEATEVDARLTELLTCGTPRLVPYLHAPLQSGCDRVLRRMGRHWYTVASYEAAIRRIVGRQSVFGLGADVIVGFPGETDADFEETVALVERLPFTYLHVFPYSPRPGTAATRLGHVVPPSCARERAARLRELSRRKELEYRKRRAGTVADLVVIGGAPREAMTEDFLTVALDTNEPRGARFDARLAWTRDSLRVA